MKELLKKFIPPFLLSFYHFSLAFFGALLCGFPGRKLKVIGITGTNGKSTTVHFLSELLEKTGQKTSSISSVRFKIGGKEWPNALKMTMPGRFKIQRFLKEAVGQGCSHAVLEVTSEGIKQYRHRFIGFEAVVFTNLSPEHIESHGSFENYKRAKGKLFKLCRKTHIVNRDDKWAGYFLQFPSERKIEYGLKGKNPFVQGKEVPLGWDTAEFNLYNASAAMACALSQGIPLEESRKLLEKAKKVPGRLEVVVEKPFKAVVDYAHTPDSLAKVYSFLLKQKPFRLICLLGSCGGGRDKWKRPELGKIAAGSCDKIFLTNEDPYDEKPEEILSQIEKGFSESLNPKPDFEKIADRREAVKKALEEARAGDIVVFTGKGSEPWICLGKGKKAPWNEKQVILEEFQRLPRS